ncbi:Flagellar basal body-associated protein FliL [uncultured delta proteobacterium]|uniref:Flagellar protein FliL n=1 Tax=uncultured delta proteobacterium TaxID=34034 RepID=A0A212J6J6_9DELT|nr:Flagellar basal body-associated protein FliL [uncultured delta proteobacterium]
MADDDDKPKKKGKLKWILMILFLLLFVGGGVGAWYYFFSDLPGSRKASQESSGGAASPQTVQTKVAPNLQTAVLDTFLVNLADPLGKRYIKVTFEVEVVEPKVVDELSRQKPKIRDTIIMLLSSKTYADLAPPESKLELKNEVTNRLNQILGGPKVSRVFITDIVIQ